MKNFLFTLLLPLMLPAGEVIFKNDFKQFGLFHYPTPFRLNTLI